MQQMRPPHVARRERESCIDFDFLELTLERSRARLRPRQESIRRTTCQRLVFCDALQLACPGSWHHQTGKYSSAEFSSFPNRPSFTCHMGRPLSKIYFRCCLLHVSSLSSSLFIFRARIVASQLTFTALCFYHFAAPPDRLGTTFLTKSSLTSNS
jgi:hypothetical protein